MRTEYRKRRTPFRRRRCLVPASGFNEWKREGDHRQPYYIARKDGQLFRFYFAVQKQLSVVLLQPS